MVMKERSVSKSHFKTHALQLFREVENTSTPLVITDRGTPVLRLVPYQESQEELLASLRGTVTSFNAPLEPVGLDDWEAVRGG